jgi:hypothetical protein
MKRWLAAVDAVCALLLSPPGARTNSRVVGQLARYHQSLAATAPVEFGRAAAFLDARDDGFLQTTTPWRVVAVRIISHM